MKALRIALLPLWVALVWWRSRHCPANLSIVQANNGEQGQIVWGHLVDGYSLYIWSTDERGHRSYYATWPALQRALRHKRLLVLLP